MGGYLCTVKSVLLISAIVAMSNASQTQTDLFRILYTNNYEKLCCIAFRIVMERETAREIAQNVFLSFWERRDQWPSIQSPEGYLCRMTYHQALNHRTRSRDYKQSEVSASERAHDANPEELLEGAQVEQLVATVLGNLPEKCQLIFMLSREEGLTYGEIARRLNLSVKTVEHQMGIALSRFRKALMSSSSIPSAKIFSIFI